MRLNVKQLADGKFAAFAGKRAVYTNTIRDTEREAKIARLHQIGQDAQAVIDRVDAELRKLDAYDERDPHGYLA